MNIVKQDLLQQFLKNLWIELWKGWMLFVTKSSLLFRWLWPYCDQNKLPSDIMSYRLRMKRKSSKIWTNFEQDVDKNWAKSTLNFDIFYIRLLRLCEVKKDLNCLISHVLKHLFYKGLHIYICQNQMGYHEMGIFVALYLIFVRVHQLKQKLDQWFCWNNYIIISKGKLMLCHYVLCQ